MAMPYAATANACACVIQLPLNKNMLLDLEDYFGSFHWAAANAYISHSNFVSDCCAIFVWYFFLYSSSSLSLSISIYLLHLSFRYISIYFVGLAAEACVTGPSIGPSHHIMLYRYLTGAWLTLLCRVQPTECSRSSDLPKLILVSDELQSFFRFRFVVCLLHY